VLTLSFIGSTVFNYHSLPSMVRKGRWRKDLKNDHPENEISGLTTDEVVYATPSGIQQNVAGDYALKALKSQISVTSTQLMADIHTCLRGGTIYIPGWACNREDWSLFHALRKELPEDKVDWSKHQKYEDPALSTTFEGLQKRLSEYFDLDVFAWRLNVYSSGEAWKPFHHDSHAYSKDKGEGEDFTCGVSLGASRDLAFRHVESQTEFAVPQHNGDVFSFTNEINRLFEHGVPKSSTKEERLSIIAWGKRRKMTERNGGIFRPV